MALSFKDVAEILKIVDASDCEEVVLEVEGIRLVVRRGGGGGSEAPTPGKPVSAGTDVAEPASGGGKQGDFAVNVGDGHVGVRAPMVGTAYLRPAPDEPVFVEAGTRVEKGAPLCLIEVMKLYTTIEAVAAGVIAVIHVDDGSLVEFDQLLFEIKPE